MKVSAMHHRIRVAETRAKGITEVDMRDLLGADRIHQAKLIDIDRHATGSFADAEIIEGMEGVRSKLNASPDFPKRRRFFEQDRGASLLRKPKCCGEAADATA